MGKSTISMVIFQSKLLVHQRVKGRNLGATVGVVGVVAPGESRQRQQSLWAQRRFGRGHRRSLRWPGGPGAAAGYRRWKTRQVEGGFVTMTSWEYFGVHNFTCVFFGISRDFNNMFMGFDGIPSSKIPHFPMKTSIFCSGMSPRCKFQPPSKRKKQQYIGRL